MDIAGRNGPSADEDSGLVDRNQVDGVMAIVASGELEMLAEPTKAFRARCWQLISCPGRSSVAHLDHSIFTRSLGDGIEMR